MYDQLLKEAIRKKLNRAKVKVKRFVKEVMEDPIEESAKSEIRGHKFEERLKAWKAKEKKKIARKYDTRWRTKDPRYQEALYDLDEKVEKKRERYSEAESKQRWGKARRKSIRSAAKGLAKGVGLVTGVGTAGYLGLKALKDNKEDVEKKASLKNKLKHEYQKLKVKAKRFKEDYDRPLEHRIYSEKVGRTKREAARIKRQKEEKELFERAQAVRSKKSKKRIKDFHDDDKARGKGKDPDEYRESREREHRQKDFRADEDFEGDRFYKRFKRVFADRDRRAARAKKIVRRAKKAAIGTALAGTAGGAYLATRDKEDKKEGKKK